MIKISSLAHTYPQGQHLTFADWEIGEMEQWILLGSSGSGKSTLLNHISGLLKPTEGIVSVNDINLYSMSARKMDEFRGRHIGIVFQRPHLIRSLTVLENLELASSMAGTAVDKERNFMLLNDLGLKDKAKSYPDELSQGQMQRVSVARALVNRPDILIADEPTSSLDDKTTEQVIEMLTSQASNNGASLLIATHDGRVKKLISKTYVL